ncbi:MAG: heme biosynthesis HemY N-terminal domain-containing protein [Alphaproteobacteria bacterium]
MRRILFFLGLTTLLGGLFWSTLQLPQPVTLAWEGYQVETHLAVLLAGFLGAFLALRWAEGLCRLILSFPSRWAAWFEKRKEKKISQRIVELLIAWEGGDTQRTELLKQALAQELKQNPLLAFLLSRYGEKRLLPFSIQQLSNRFPQACFLGKKADIEELLLEQRFFKATEVLEQLVQQEIRLPWVFETLFALYLEQKRFVQAEVLWELFKHHLPKETAKSRKALWLYTQGMEEKELGKRVDLFKEAHALDPASGDVCVAFAKALFQQRKPEKARGALEKTWRLNPHEVLVEAYLTFAPQETSYQRVEACQILLANASPHPLNHLLLGRAALEASLWVSARKELEALAQTHPYLAYPLLALVERRQHQDWEAAYHWLEKTIF